MSEAARAMGDEGPAATCVLAAGEQLAGRFNVVRFLARGGMGEVYEAFDAVLQERVALKTLSLTTLDDAKSVEMLLAEVRLARRVTHRNVCRILELGLHHKRGESIPFLTMEFLEGETLGARLRRTGQLSSNQTAYICEQLVAGLGAIHRASIVHRDFKSDNVMLVPDAPDVERAVVMDFGLARAMTTPLSGIRVAVGTPPYMAPEQIEGKPATPAFDIYALGVVMVELLTGRLPRSDRIGPAEGLERHRRSMSGASARAAVLQRRPGRRRVAAAEEAARTPAGDAGRPRRRRGGRPRRGVRGPTRPRADTPARLDLLRESDGRSAPAGAGSAESAPSPRCAIGSGVAVRAGGAGVQATASPQEGTRRTRRAE